KLTSKEIVKSLTDTLVFNPAYNIDYNLIRFNIDKVHEAVSSNNVIEYQYGKYNIHKEFTLNRDGEIYETEPYALIWRNDYYYLIEDIYQQMNSGTIDWIGFEIFKLVIKHSGEKSSTFHSILIKASTCLLVKNSGLRLCF